MLALLLSIHTHKVIVKVSVTVIRSVSQWNILGNILKIRVPLVRPEFSIMAIIMVIVHLSVFSHISNIKNKVRHWIIIMRLLVLHTFMEVVGRLTQLLQVLIRGILTRLPSLQMLVKTRLDLFMAVKLRWAITMLVSGWVWSTSNSDKASINNTTNSSSYTHKHNRQCCSSNKRSLNRQRRINPVSKFNLNNLLSLSRVLKYNNSRSQSARRQNLEKLMRDIWISKNSSREKDQESIISNSKTWMLITQITLICISSKSS